MSSEDDLADIEEPDPDIDEYGDDEASENTSRSGSVSGYDDGDREQDSGKSSSSSNESSSGSGSGESESSSSSSDSDEDITNSVSAASTGQVATGGAPGGSP